ncbi:hypothetical protein HOD38_00435 [archaeon]|nr:hypothetical protein [archaeon]
MLDELNVLWINPPEIQLKLYEKARVRVISQKDSVLSYDVQANYPITPLVEAIRQLQSVYAGVIHPSILNLAAVPRSQFINEIWKNNYLSGKIKEIPFGSSKIEVRRIGRELLDVPNLDDIINNQDLVVVTTPYEMNVNEVRRLGKILRERDPFLLLMASGIGTETREELLLEAGFDLVFEGLVTDRGEEVLEALVARDVQKLSTIPGVYTNLEGTNIRNLPGRSFRNLQRSTHIRKWKSNLSKYFKWRKIGVNFVGREDLIEGNVTLDQSSFEPYCAFQDLPYDTLINLSRAGEELVIGAADISLSIGCFRNDCHFCTSSGKGYGTKDANYVVSLLTEYYSMGITDIIPTDDALLAGALNPSRIKGMIEIFRKLKEFDMSLFPGNGISTYSFSEVIRNSSKGNEFGRNSQKFLSLFLDVVPYFYLPVERLYAVSGEETNEDHHSKLQGARQRFCDVVQYIVKMSPRNQIEMATNIMYTSTPDETEIQGYYNAMDELVEKLDLSEKVNVRYVGFFTIPTNGAEHILDLERRYNLGFQRENPELQAVSIPLILSKEEDTFMLERRLKWNILYRNSSGTGRRLNGGTYRENS